MMTGALWIDIAGTTLSKEDCEILRHPAVSGVILFTRNYENPAQLRVLTQAIRKVSKALHVTVDQEGGRVQRFREGFTELPPMHTWGARYADDPEAAKHAFRATLENMIRELRAGGVDSTLLPVLDLDYERNTVIGHRAFGALPSVVTALGNELIDVFHRFAMPATGKHFPGHGYVTQDSHLQLPVDHRSFEEIAAQDLVPFSQLAPQLDAIMPAHIIYDQVDPSPACLSRFWIQEVLRKRLKFRGRVITDDLSMAAMAGLGNYPDRAAKALAAGCDTLLVCNAREG